MRGFTDTIKEIAPEMNVIEYATAFTREDGLKDFTDILAANKQIDAVYSLDDRNLHRRASRRSKTPAAPISRSSPAAADARNTSRSSRARRHQHLLRAVQPADGASGRGYGGFRAEGRKRLIRFWLSRRRSWIAATWTNTSIEQHRVLMEFLRRDRPAAAAGEQGYGVSHSPFSYPKRGTTMKLKMDGICKSFGSNEVLKSVGFQLSEGEICALLGENGAGKSTLMNILGGVLQPDSGEILLDGQKRKFDSPAQSLDAGIAFIHQELNLINDLPIYENMFIGRELKKKSGLLDHKRMIEETRRVF